MTSFVAHRCTRASVGRSTRCLEYMVGQRRYGTATAKSSGLVGGARTTISANQGRQVPLAPKSTSSSAAPAYETPNSPIILDGPHAKPFVKRGELAAEDPSSEREPLLLAESHGTGVRSTRHCELGGRWNQASESPKDVGGWSGGVFSPGSSRRDNGKVVTMVLVLSYMIGSGILNSSQVFSESGVATATIFYVMSGTLVLNLVIGLLQYSCVQIPHRRDRCTPYCSTPRILQLENRAIELYVIKGLGLPGVTALS